MNEHPRVRERISRAFQFKLGLADFHALAFGLSQNAGRLVDAGDQFVDARAHHAGRREALITVGVTIDAERALLCSNQRIIGFENRVIAVTGDALAQLLVIEGCLVRARLKKFSLARVTLAADVGYRSDAWRRRTVIAVTVVTRRGRQILLH